MTLLEAVGVVLVVLGSSVVLWVVIAFDRSGAPPRAVRPRPAEAPWRKAA